MIWLDWAVRFLPAIVVFTAILVARSQIRAARRATSITIAKNYYRKMLSLFQSNTDILYCGMTYESLLKLKKDDPKNYVRYRMLFTNMVFSCQEIFFAIDTDKEKHWGHSLRIFMALFRGFINSDEFASMMQAALHPKFVAFMKKAASEAEHPAVKELRDAGHSDFMGLASGAIKPEN